MVLSVCDLQIFLSHPSLVIYFFPTPSIKLKLGQQIGGRLLIGTQFAIIGQKKTASTCHIIFITLFSGRCYGLLCHLPASPNCNQILGAIAVLLSQTGMF